MGKAAYGPEVREAAKTLHLEGLSSAEIRARLMAGEAGLPYTCEPGERTIDNWRRGWKREGLRQGLTVRAGDEESVEKAIYRRLLALYREALIEMEKNLEAGKRDLALVKEIEVLQRVVDGARAKRRIAKKQETAKLTPEEGAELGASAAASTPGSMLEKLAAAEEARAQTDGPGEDQPPPETP